MTDEQLYLKLAEEKHQRELAKQLLYAARSGVLHKILYNTVDLLVTETVVEADMIASAIIPVAQLAQTVAEGYREV